MNPAELELAFGDDRLFARVAGRALSFVYGAGSLSHLGNAVPQSVLASTTVPVDALLVALGQGATKGVLHTRADQLVVNVGGREGFLLFPVTGQPLDHSFQSHLFERVRARLPLLSGPHELRRPCGTHRGAARRAERLHGAGDAASAAPMSRSGPRLG